MELRVKTPTFPEVIQFNYDELKQEITEKVANYANLVYTDEQISEAKKDRATLNKFVKAIEDERKKVKNDCLKPYEDFEKKIKELNGIVNNAITNIDKQVKDYEEQKKAEKKEKIIELYKNTVFPDWVKFEHIFDVRWLNSSVSIAAITKELIAKCEKIESDLTTLSNLPEFGFEAVEVYKSTFDINRALNDGKRLAEIQKRKSEAERMNPGRDVVVVPDGVYVQDKDKQGFTFHEEQLPGQISFTDAESFENNCIVPKAEEKPFEECMNPPVEERDWAGFKAYLTEKEAFELADFFNTRGIQYEAIKI